MLPKLKEDLVVLVEDSLHKKATETPNPNAYTPESRVNYFQELKEQKEAQEEEAKKNSMFADYNDHTKKREGPIPVHNKDGAVLQCNEGKYEWLFSESKDGRSIILTIQIPKYMSTTLINIDLNPTYVRMDIKGKTTQLLIPEEIIVEKSKSERS